MLPGWTPPPPPAESVGTDTIPRDAVQMPQGPEPLQPPYIVPDVSAAVSAPPSYVAPEPPAVPQPEPSLEATVPQGLEPPQPPYIVPDVSAAVSAPPYQPEPTPWPATQYPVQQPPAQTQPYGTPMPAATLGAPYASAPQPPYNPPGAYAAVPGPGYGQPGWTPPPPNKKKPPVLMIIIVAVVVLALVGVVVWQVSSRPEPRPTATTSTSKTPVPTYTPKPTGPTQESTPSPGATPQATAPPAEPGAAGVGETVTIEKGKDTTDFIVTANGFTLGKLQNFFAPGAGMIFVIVPGKVTYRGTSNVYWLPPVTLVNTDGSLFEEDSSGEVLYVPDGATHNELFLAAMSPGETVQGAWVFQVPADKASGYVLRVGADVNKPVDITIGL